MLHAICCDLEGVFVPEVWINVAKKTGIEELKLTTRDISDYDVLMKKRLGILKKHGLKLKEIQKVIDTLEPLEGAIEFLDWLKEVTRVIIVSDTFVEFADPLMKKLNRPTLFCNYLSVNGDGMVTDYHRTSRRNPHRPGSNAVADHSRRRRDRFPQRLDVQPAEVLRAD